MIKFKAVKEGVTLVGLGISERNVEYLKDAHPIVVKLKDLGIDRDIEIMIFYGATEEVMATELKSFINADTVIHETGRSIE